MSSMTSGLASGTSSPPDVEKEAKDAFDGSESAALTPQPSGDGLVARIIDGFRPATVQTEGATAVDGHFDAHAAAKGTVDCGLQRSLRGRHLQMIAIGGAIGECARPRVTRADGQAPGSLWRLGRRWPLAARRRC
jgi:hypothetical protein